VGKIEKLLKLIWVDFALSEVIVGSILETLPVIPDVCTQKPETEI